MDRDEFSITVYCLVCEHYRVIKNTYPVRQGGFAPALTDEEVITLGLCGESCKLPTDTDLFGYFRTPYAHCFPPLRERTLCVRQAANLWQVKAALHQRRTHGSGQATDPVQILATLPLPVCGSTRRGRDRWFKPFADSGPCAAKNLRKVLAHTVGVFLNLQLGQPALDLDGLVTV